MGQVTDPRLENGTFFQPGDPLRLCLDDIRSTLDLMEAAYEARVPGLLYVKQWPALWGPELQDEPRFQALLERMNLRPAGG